MGTAINDQEKENATSLDSTHTPLHYTSSSMDDNGVTNEQMKLLLRSGKKKVMLEEVVQHLRKITDKIKEKDEQERLQSEWKIVAKILDRFSLIVFVFLVIISSLVLLYVYPMSAREKNQVMILAENNWCWPT